MIKTVLHSAGILWSTKIHPFTVHLIQMTKDLTVNLPPNFLHVQNTSLQALNIYAIHIQLGLYHTVSLMVYFRASSTWQILSHLLHSLCAIKLFFDRWLLHKFSGWTHYGSQCACMFKWAWISIENGKILCILCETKWRVGVAIELQTCFAF